MLIAFEGIDGSGKTTLSLRLADRLRALGRPVLHLREGGILRSRISASIRELTRDRRNLELCDRAELLLNCARETQLVRERVRPALEAGEVVVADRSLYSHLALACAGRSLPEEEARGVVSFASAGLEPDLVVLVDVDPGLAKARKRCRKLGEPNRAGGSRKGLAGDGLAVRVRETLLGWARNNPGRWLVVDSGSGTLDQLETTVFQTVAHRLGLAAAPPLEPVPVTRVATGRLDRLDERVLRERFLALIEPLALREPGAAAVLLTGLDVPEADAVRLRLAERAPDAVAYSLSGLDGEPAWELRARLERSVPKAVAASLSGLPETATTRADTMRDSLASLAPREVLRGLAGRSDEAASRLRESLTAAAPDAVLASLAGVDDARAWMLRDRLGSAHPEGLLDGLARLDTDRAWALRREWRDSQPLAFVASLAGLVSDEASRHRRAWIDLAPRPVLRGLARVDHPEAWALRNQFLERAPEALDGFSGLGTEEAWHLRDRGAVAWPVRAVRSLGFLSRTPRGTSFLTAIARRTSATHLTFLRSALLALHARELPSVPAPPDAGGAS